jgi:hypothetical protein
MSQLYGTLCLSATTPQKDFPQLESTSCFSGHHTPHKFRGHYQLLGTGEDIKSVDTLHLPQRQKSFTILTNSAPDFAERVNLRIEELLPQMEAEHEGARQLYKFNEIQKEIKALPASQAFVTTIVNNGQHGHIAILSQWRDVYVYGIYDTENCGIRLAWTTDEWFVNDIRAVDFTRYVFFRYPVLQDRPLFLYAQALCSKWYKWSQQFKGQDDCILRSFNALENYLYKEAELPQLQITNGNRSAYASK